MVGTGTVHTVQYIRTLLLFLNPVITVLWQYMSVFVNPVAIHMVYCLSAWPLLTMDSDGLGFNYRLIPILGSDSAAIPSPPPPPTGTLSTIPNDYLAKSPPVHS